jgi:DNA-binding response OmpR family regulator
MTRDALTMASNARTGARLLFGTHGSSVPTYLLGTGDRCIPQREAHLLAAINAGTYDALILDCFGEARDVFPIVQSVRREHPALPILGRVRSAEDEDLAAGFDGAFSDDVARGALEARVVVSRSRRWLRTRAMRAAVPTALIVSARDTERLQQGLRSAAFRACVCTSAKEALEQLRTQFCPVLLIDLALGAMPLGELLAAARRFDLRHVALAIVATDAAGGALAAMREGASGYLRVDAGRAEIQYVMRNVWAEWLVGGGRAREPQAITSVLVVEDDPAHADLIEELLSVPGERAYVLHRKARIEDAVQWARTHTPDVVLLDLGLPDSTGLESIARLQAELQQVPILVLTGAERALGATAISLGAEDFIGKDVLLAASHEPGADLRARIDYAVARRAARDRQFSRMQDMAVERELPWSSIHALPWPCALMETRGSVLFVNQAWATWTSRPESEWIGTAIDAVDLPGQDSGELHSPLLPRSVEARRVSRSSGGVWLLTPKANSL